MGEFREQIECALDGVGALPDTFAGLGAGHAGTGDAEGHWSVTLDGDVGQAGRHAVGDHPVVVGVAGDDGADHGDGVHLLPAGEAIGRERRVVDPRDGDGLGDIGVGVSGSLAGPLFHPLGDRPVEPGDHQTERGHTATVAWGPQRATALDSEGPAVGNTTRLTLSTNPRTMARGSRDDRTLPALLAVAALAVAVRLAFLGERVAHWDEGRVGYDILRYGETGLWEYRSIVHGPFLVHVNDVVFALLGPTDFAMRLVVACVGGLLPLAAWLFRDHLRPLEVVSVGALLAASPILVYYSRFMRNDVLVATFMLVALGTVARFLDTGRARYLYAAALFGGLGFTTKENAVVYVACWLGAGALLLDTALFRPNAARPTRALLHDRFVRGREHVRSREIRRLAGRYAAHLALATALFVAVLVVFYAPRTAGTGVGFERLASRPDLLPTVAERALADFWGGIADWGGKPGDESMGERLTDYLPRFLSALAAYAPAISVLAVAGILGERYLAERPRPIVMGFAYWGIVSLPGYALAMDVWATWALVHVLVPLAVPAGVALAWILRVGLGAARDLRAGTRGSRAGADALLAGAVVLVLVGSTVAIVGATAFDPTNTRTDGDHVVQYAQPNQELREPLADVETALAETGDSIVYYGEYAIDNESAAYRPPVEGRWVEDEEGLRQIEDNSNWYSRLPLPWYVERTGAESMSAHGAGDLERLLAEEAPAAVVVGADRDGELPAMAGYLRTTIEMRSPGTEIVLYVRADALESRGEPADAWVHAATETGGNGNP